MAARSKGLIGTHMLFSVGEYGYSVVSNTDLYWLVSEVNDRIKQGWRPLGGVSITVSEEKISTPHTVYFDGSVINTYTLRTYVQAMIKDPE
jgi:hypothetical protein